ncbi:hypothetical protein SAMN06296952_1675 [Oscillospiraceae bacterium]|nr:hypothetical protein SAMN06296952_1675 [Oscillospiraceae bacterium]
MREIWNKYIKTPAFLYCFMYTLATLTNSVIYLAQGTFEDPSGNWHELDRAVIVFIAVLAYALIRYIKMKSFWLKVACVYVPTMLLTFFYVFLRGLTVELASSAYRDIFVNYTAGFVFVTLVVFVVTLVRKKKAAKKAAV